MRKHKSDRIIGALTVILLGMGLIVIYAIGPMRANVMNATYGTDYSDNYFFFRQLFSVVLSLAVIVLAFRVPYRIVRKFGKLFLVLGLLLCALLAVLSWMNSPLVSCQLGACRWFDLGGMLSLQPAEILKLGLVLYLAGFLAEKRKNGMLDSIVDFWLPFGIACGLSLVFVIVIQKDLGTGTTLIAIIMAMLFMSGVSLKKYLVVCVLILIAGAIAILGSPYRRERLLTFSSDESSDSYHIENAMIAIGTGGFLGVGIGNSVQATGYLPESINDSVFAVMGETFGFVGLVAIIASFTLLLMRLLRTANYLHDDEESLVVIGVFAWAAAHVIVNIAAMTSLIPLTGITLPLLSYGGTSMLFMAAALGLALQLSCYTSREPRKEQPRVSRKAVENASPRRRQLRRNV